MKSKEEIYMRTQSKAKHSSWRAFWGDSTEGLTWVDVVSAPHAPTGCWCFRVSPAIESPWIQSLPKTQPVLLKHPFNSSKFLNHCGEKKTQKTGDEFLKCGHTTYWFFNHFTEEGLPCKKLYVIKAHNLMSLEISVYLWNHRHNLCCNHIHHLQKFTPTFFIFIILF